VGGHAVVVVGYDNDRQWWLCKNSWGTSGGINGTGFFKIGFGERGFNALAAEATMGLVYTPTMAADTGQSPRPARGSRPPLSSVTQQPVPSPPLAFGPGPATGVYTLAANFSSRAELGNIAFIDGSAPVTMLSFQVPGNFHPSNNRVTLSMTGTWFTRSQRSSKDESQVFLRMASSSSSRLLVLPGSGATPAVPAVRGRATAVNVPLVPGRTAFGVVQARNCGWRNIVLSVTLEFAPLQ
jgi:hypothetical protein